MSSAEPAMWPSQPLLMGIFALHNLEETLSIDRDAAFNEDRLNSLGFDRSWYRQDRMALATGLLTAISYGLSRKLDNPENTRQAFLGAAATRNALAIPLIALALAAACKILK